jgi:hypothetical protein
MRFECHPIQSCLDKGPSCECRLDRPICAARPFGCHIQMAKPKNQFLCFVRRVPSHGNDAEALLHVLLRLRKGGAIVLAAMAILILVSIPRAIPKEYQIIWWP